MVSHRGSSNRPHLPGGYQGAQLGIPPWVPLSKATVTAHVGFLSLRTTLLKVLYYFLVLFSLLRGVGVQGQMRKGRGRKENTLPS